MSFLKSPFGPPDIQKLIAQDNVNGLINALVYKDSSIAIMAANALGGICNTKRDYYKKWDTSYYHKMNATTVTAKTEGFKNWEASGEKARKANQDADAIIKGLVVALSNNEDQQVRKAIVEALVEIGDKESCEMLATSLQDDAMHDVVESVLEDVIIHKPLKESEDDPRLYLVEALGKNGGKYAANLLSQAANSPTWSRRTRAAIFLAGIGDVRAFDPLIAELDFKDDKNSYSRERAVRALGELGDTRAIEPLIEVLKMDNNSKVRSTAARALEALGWQPTDEAERVYLTITRAPTGPKWKEQWEGLENLGPTAWEPLVLALKDDYYLVRRAALKALGQFRDDRTLDTIISMLNDRDESTWLLAAELLGQRADSRAIKALWDKLMNYITKYGGGTTGAPAGLVRALGQAGGVSVIAPLLGLFDNIRNLRDTRGYENLLSEIVKVLGEIGDERVITPIMSYSEDMGLLNRQLEKWQAEKALEKVRERLGKKHLEDLPLVQLLTSDKLSDREKGLQQVLAEAQLGDIGSLHNIEEAIRVLAERSDITFYHLGIRNFSIDEPAHAFEKILTLARERQLLQNPEQTQALIPLIGMSGEANHVMSEIERIGGPEGLRAYQLLGVHLQVYSLLAQKGIV